MKITDLLEKFSLEPGLMTHSQILEVKKFLVQFNNDLKIYRKHYGDPIGFSVDSLMDKVEFYEQYHNK